MTSKKDVSGFDGLNFPVFDQPLPGPPILSMDAYYDFVWQMNTKIFPHQDRNSSPEPVKTRFTLK